MNYLLALYLQFVLAEAGVPLGKEKVYTDAGILSLGVADNGDYAPFRLDAQGAIIFRCRYCPATMCKEMACRGKIDAQGGEMVFDCKCRSEFKYVCNGDDCQ